MAAPGQLWNGIINGPLDGDQYYCLDLSMYPGGVLLESYSQRGWTLHPPQRVLRHIVRSQHGDADLRLLHADPNRAKTSSHSFKEMGSRDSVWCGCIVSGSGTRSEIVVEAEYVSLAPASPA